jgi:hypothetical protein
VTIFIIDWDWDWKGFRVDSNFLRVFENGAKRICGQQLYNYFLTCGQQPVIGHLGLTVFFQNPLE